MANHDSPVYCQLIYWEKHNIYLLKGERKEIKAKKS